MNDYILVFLDSEKGRYIEVFNRRDFKLKGVFEVKEKGYCYPTNQGTIYFWNDEEEKIIKYKILIKNL